MDCHLSNTHFSLLGFFKEPDYGDWFEQLFNYEGDCVWTDEEYQFMQSFRSVWPLGCTASDTVVPTQNGSNTTSLFYDLKPSMYGEMEIGLYTDNKCIQEYKGTSTTENAMRDLVCSDQLEGTTIAGLCATGKANMIAALTMYNKQNGTNIGQGDELGGLWGLVSQLEKWNQAFDVFKQCQPCKTYDLTNIVAGKGYQKSFDSRYNWTSAIMLDGDADIATQYGDFRCHDATSYENGNQVRFHDSFL